MPSTTAASKPGKTSPNTAIDIREALGGLRQVFASVLAISAIVNVLALTGALYMLQVYDRVLTSHSVPTLVALTVLVVGLYLIQGILDVLRGQVLIRLGARINRRLSPLAHTAVLHLPLAGLSATDATQPLRDVETIRSFFDRQGPVALCDLPWIPLYLAFVFFLHPWLGFLATTGLLVLIALTGLSERTTHRLQAQARTTDSAQRDIASAHARNAEVLRAMGLGARASERFRDANAQHLAVQTHAGDVAGTITGVTKVFRLMLQSAILGLGAYLTLQGQITAGVIIAASVAATRAFAPIENAISHWKSFIAARQSYQHLKKIISKLPDTAAPLDLAPPTKTLDVDDILVAAPATDKASQQLILHNISFTLTAGQGLGIIGPSAAGKSTLARAIVGVWPAARGAIRFDGAARERWSIEKLGASVGYLPQDIELFGSNIADNIARFDPDAEANDIIAAAQSAGVHEMNLRLPDGYETTLGPDGQSLSAGQRQRIALARALYGEPFLVVLDEPNANLDHAGDAALHDAIQSIRQRGGIVIVIAHRPSGLGAVDMVAVLADGRLKEFGRKDEVLRKVLQQPIAAKAS